MGKATNFKSGRYIHRVHLNKSPFTILGKKGAWAYPGTAQIFEYPLLSQEWVKLRTSSSVRTYLVLIGTKPITNFGKSSRWHIQGLSKFFRVPMYWAYRAVIFAIAQLSCYFSSHQHKVCRKNIV